MSPYRRDLPGTGDPYGTGGGLSGLEDLLARPPQPKPYYRPYERQSLGNLIDALRSGLDPSTAFQMLSGIQGEAGQRHDEQQAMRQQTQSQASDALLQLAQTNPDPAAAETYLGAFGTLHPGMAPQATGRLDELVGQLYPGGEQSPLYAAPAGSTSLDTLSPDDVAGISSDVKEFVASKDPTTGQIVSTPLHDTRMAIMTQLRAQGYGEAALQQAYDLVGHMYTALGGNAGGTPVTTADRVAAAGGLPGAPGGGTPAAAPGAPAPWPAPSVGGTSTANLAHLPQPEDRSAAYYMNPLHWLGF